MISEECCVFPHLGTWKQREGRKCLHWILSTTSSQNVFGVYKHTFLAEHIEASCIYFDYYLLMIDASELLDAKLKC